MRPINEIILHCTATKPEWMAGKPTRNKVQEIDRWHRERGWSEIGYHYVIDRDGTVAPGRAISKIGAHVKGHNTGTIGISLIGGHGGSADDKFEDHFTPAQDAAVRNLIADLQGRYPINKLSGHNAYAAKACPCFRVDPWYHSRRDEPAPKPAKVSLIDIILRILRGGK